MGLWDIQDIYDLDPMKSEGSPIQQPWPVQHGPAVHAAVAPRTRHPRAPRRPGAPEDPEDPEGTAARGPGGSVVLKQLSEKMVIFRDIAWLVI